MLNLKPAKERDFWYHTLLKQLAEEVEYNNADVTDAHGKKIDYVSRLETKRDEEFCLYVIGPVSQKPNFNLARFRKVQYELEKFGIRVVIPHDIIDKSSTWLSALSQSLSCIEQATAVVLIEDDETQSLGATIEREACVGANIMCIPYKQWLEILDTFQKIYKDEDVEE